MKRTTLTKLAIAFILLLTLSAAVAAQTRFGDAIRTGSSSAVRGFENIIMSYPSYQKGIDFILLFALFMAIFMIGLKAWLKENNRQATVLAVVISLMATIAIVVGTNFSILMFAPYMKYVGFILLTAGIYWMLAGTGMIKSKLVAFLLAVVASFIIFILLSNIFMPSWRGMDIGDRISNVFGTSGIRGGISGSGSIERGGTGDILETAHCKQDFPDAFPKDDKSLKDAASLDDFARSCIGTMQYTAFSSSDEASTIAEERKIALGMHFNGIFNGQIRLIPGPGGSTWDFTPDFKKLDKTEKDKLTAEQLAPNRAVKLECECTKEGASYDSYLEHFAPKSCKELVKDDLYTFFYKAVRTTEREAKKILGKEVIDEDEVKKWKTALDQCESEYQKNKDDPLMRQVYVDALLKFHGALGRAYFSAEMYADAASEYRTLAEKAKKANNSDTVKKALDEYYGQVIDKYKARESEIMKLETNAVKQKQDVIKQLLEINRRLKEIEIATEQQEFIPYKP